MKICIIKLGALGDVIRTIPILEAIEEKYPHSEISWVTKESSLNILETNPSINKIITLPNQINDNFDILFNFDIDETAIKLASATHADKKYGFCEEGGYASACNLSAEYYLNTLFDDETKKTNKKTYQEIMFGAAELPWKNQKIKIYLTKEDKKYAQNFREKNNLPEDLIGVHLGSSPRWPSKSWHEENMVEFIAELKEKGRDVLLFAGPDDTQKQKNILDQLARKGIIIATQDPFCTTRQFASLVNLCSIIITADSLALHVAIAMGKKTIALFFCTSPSEVEGYGLLKKIISPKLKDFFPEKSDIYDENLIKSISPEQVLREIECPMENRLKVVNAIILNQEKDKVLLIKRIDGIHGGKWAFPGGIVEDDESEEDALKREVMEEIHLDVLKIIKKVADYSYNREDGSLTLGSSYLVSVEGYEVKLNNEISESRWLSPEDIEKLPLAPGIDEEILSSLFS
jgi:ADP-heptose:LPS heptosyltransferase/8-oxo-dGTP pyrophosphatase MutT (NUDIX family)